MQRLVYLFLVLLLVSCNQSSSHHNEQVELELSLDFEFYENKIQELIEDKQTTFFVRNENFEFQQISRDSLWSFFKESVANESFYNYENGEEEWGEAYHYGTVRSISFQKASLYKDLIPSLSSDGLIVVVNMRSSKIENNDTIPVPGNNAFTMVVNSSNNLNVNFVFDDLLSYIESGAMLGELNVFKINWNGKDEKLSYEDIKYLWQAQIDTMDLNAEKPERIKSKTGDKLLHYRGLAEGFETITFDIGDLYNDPVLDKGTMILLGKKFIKVDTDDVEYVLGVSSMFYVGY